MYKETLFREDSSTVTMNLIRSSKHEATANNIRKIQLTPFDDKRTVLDDNISTIAYHHYRIEFIKTD